MAYLVDWQAGRNKEPYFRWFDSGDLQSPTMLERITEVARRTPGVRHWLPTREYAIVRYHLQRNEAPDNLTIRISAPFVDNTAPDILGLPTSTVHHTRGPPGYACPAYDQRPAQCGTCRACWNPEIKNISYPLH
jgi:hypothetical protein